MKFEEQNKSLLPVLGPQVDFKIWEQILNAGPGDITGYPAETVAIMDLRQMPSPYVIANGRNSHWLDFDPPTTVPGR